MVTSSSPAIDAIADGKANSKLIPGLIYGGPKSRAKVREFTTLASTKWTGTFLAIGWLFMQPTSWVEWSYFFVTYILGIMGVVIGYHRYFTHRAFETSKPMQYCIAILTQTAAQGSALRWASDHRRHHANRTARRHAQPLFRQLWQPNAQVEEVAQRPFRLVS